MKKLNQYLGAFVVTALLTSSSAFAQFGGKTAEELLKMLQKQNSANNDSTTTTNGGGGGGAVAPTLGYRVMVWMYDNDAITYTEADGGEHNIANLIKATGIPTTIDTVEEIKKYNEHIADPDLLWPILTDVRDDRVNGVLRFILKRESVTGSLFEENENYVFIRDDAVDNAGDDVRNAYRDKLKELYTDKNISFIINEVHEDCDRVGDTDGDDGDDAIGIDYTCVLVVEKGEVKHLMEYVLDTPIFYQLDQHDETIVGVFTEVIREYLASKHTSTRNDTHARKLEKAYPSLKKYFYTTEDGLLQPNGYRAPWDVQNNIDGAAGGYADEIFGAAKNTKAREASLAFIHEYWMRYFYELDTEAADIIN
ncbi:MAG: hypothetical protein KDK51_01410 [Deltaproteobacteria bacterium]|nr:hypothetical protein [Deltaproteobacteria bacterium]